MLGRHSETPSIHAHVSFTREELCRHVQAPTSQHMKDLLSFVRCYAGTFDWELVLVVAHKHRSIIVAYTDATGQDRSSAEASLVIVCALMEQWFRTGHELRKCMQRAARKLSCMQWKQVAEKHWLCVSSFCMRLSQFFHLFCAAK